MVNLTHEFYNVDPLPESQWKPTTSSACGNKKKKKKRGCYPSADQTNTQSMHPNDIPILKSNHTIHVSYTYTTYTLSLSIIALCLFIVLQQPFPWGHTFPPVFLLFQIAFHSIHIIAHTFDFVIVERCCIVYGTWLCWTGWLLSKLLFTEKLFHDNHTAHILVISLFWLLMLERRNAWGTIAWESVSQFNTYTATTATTATSSESDGSTTASSNDMENNFSFHLFVFRIWCLLSTGSFWGLVYMGLARWDGYPFNYLLQWHHIMKLLLISSIGGFMMIIFWSFWTFQLKGILWQRDLRKGIIVWCNDGIAYAAEVK
ncbi:hypothetical protein BDF20DRAFT_894302 [Mycotypha africana]|uniref:uncharacterized protein n=1 Tax=Mycotypha africana TaxID=64632 RepID=UPI002300D10A|nr:uncharacterized protein BDF20DRAFT_894302 [Mycotypha africana]KAI8969300.1 hypothetical protein BDF20DRAFT_894302 [Mycotypha africana]